MAERNRLATAPKQIVALLHISWILKAKLSFDKGAPYEKHV